VIRQTGSDEASNLSTTGGSVPGGSRRRLAIARFEMLVTAESALVPGWK
jgi:ABC-type transport system involved in cytochrome bd biosynthesis fused ATPase/permease subunit